MKNFIAGIVIAIVAAATILLSAHHIAQTLYNNQISRCESGVVLRREINQRLNNIHTAISTDTHVIVQFLDYAGAARKANYKTLHEAADLKASQEYYQLATQVSSTGFIPNVAPIAIVDCKKVIKKPSL